MKKISSELPPKLESSLAFLTALSRKIFSLKFGALLILSLSVSWLALFLSDRLWDTPVWARIVFSCSGWVAALAFAWMIQAIAFNRSSSIKWLARQVRNKFGGPGDRFLGIIESTQKPYFSCSFLTYDSCHIRCSPSTIKGSNFRASLTKFCIICSNS